jgi:FkbM family methyltransferase
MNLNEYHRWVKDNGDATLRLNYPLTESSIVFDLGGYMGEWAQSIVNLYNCNVFVFEPIKEFAITIENKFKNNKKVRVVPSGASTSDCESLISVEGDASSMFSTNATQKISLIDITKFIKENNISQIDLMKINIEGEEYDVMEHLVKTNMHILVDNFQIQYHTNIQNFKQRRDDISSHLSVTHDLHYRYDFVWEGWKRK